MLSQDMILNLCVVLLESLISPTPKNISLEMLAYSFATSTGIASNCRQIDSKCYRKNEHVLPSFVYFNKSLVFATTKATRCKAFKVH